MFFRMRSAGAVRGRDVGAFKVNSGNPSAEFRVGSARFVNRADGMGDHVMRLGRNCWAEGRYAHAKQRVGNGAHVGRTQCRRGEFAPSAAVDLQIAEAGRQEGHAPRFLIGAEVFDTFDSFAPPVQPHRLARIKSTAGDVLQRHHNNFPNVEERADVGKSCPFERSRLRQCIRYVCHREARTDAAKDRKT